MCDIFKIDFTPLSCSHCFENGPLMATWTTLRTPTSPVLSHLSSVLPSRPESIWEVWRGCWEKCKRFFPVRRPQHKKWSLGETSAQEGQWFHANCPNAPFNRLTPCYPFKSAWKEPPQQAVSSLHCKWLPEDPWSLEACGAKRSSAYRGDRWLLSTWLCEEWC